MLYEDLVQYLLEEMLYISKYKVHLRDVVSKILYMAYCKVCCTEHPKYSLLYGALYKRCAT
jgi:hypothetical protein